MNVLVHGREHLTRVTQNRLSDDLELETGRRELVSESVEFETDRLRRRVSRHLLDGAHRERYRLKRRGP
jgi:hypothetical protein